MIAIYSADEARLSILRRDNALEPHVPDALRDGVTRIFGEALTPAAAVERVLHDVATRGDAALLEWTERIDGVQLDTLAVAPSDIQAALAALDTDLSDALRVAADRIRGFHALQPIGSWTTDSLGGRLGQRVTPLRRVGVYVPGGTAPLPSSLLMSAIPAQVAGVAEIVVVTPPGRDGRVSPIILAAAAIMGIETIYTLGGAQAVAALAYGTESIPRVDKIVGPGNIFVTLAKRRVFGMVGIDGLNGPTETVIIADASANPVWVAADLLAQAEHDTLATAILLTPSRPLAEAVQAEVARQMEFLSRDGVIAAALAEQGGSLSPAIWPKRSGWLMILLRSISVLPLNIPKRYPTPYATPAGCFSASARSRYWAITWPVPATRCQPAVRRALLRHSTYWTSCGSPASSIWMSGRSTNWRPWRPGWRGPRG